MRVISYLLLDFLTIVIVAAVCYSVYAIGNYLLGLELTKENLYAASMALSVIGTLALAALNILYPRTKNP